MKIKNSLPLAAILFSNFFVFAFAGATPCSPENLHIISTTKDSVMLGWSSPGWMSGCRYDGATTIRGYRLSTTEYTPNGVVLNKNLIGNIGTGETYTLQLKSNTKYSVSLSTEYTDGAISGEVTLSNVILANESAVCSVMNVNGHHISSDSDGIMEISWNESCPSSAIRPLAYVVSANYDTVVAEIPPVSVNGVYSTKVNLEKGTYYQINVYPKYTNTPDSTKYGSYTSFITTGTKSVASSSVVQNQSSLRFLNPNLATGGVTLNWNLPTNAPVSELYRVAVYEIYYNEYDPNGGALPEKFQTTIPATNSYFVSSLKKDTKYTITLKGKSSAGEIITIDTLTGVPLLSKQTRLPVNQITPINNTYVLQVIQNNVLIRGNVQSVDGDTFTVRTIGSVWKVKLNQATQFVSSDSMKPAVRVGDYIGVRGKLSTTADFTLVADIFRNRTINP